MASALSQAVQLSDIKSMGLRSLMIVMKASRPFTVECGEERVGGDAPIKQLEQFRAVFEFDSPSELLTSRADEVAKVSSCSSICLSVNR